MVSKFKAKVQSLLRTVLGLNKPATRRLYPKLEFQSQHAKETLDLGLWTLDWLGMINYSENSGSLTFNVRVVPRASRSEIAGEHDGALRVRIAAPPVDGAANEELVRLLARKLGISRGAIKVASGQTSKLKVISVTGGSPAALAALIDDKPAW